MKVSGISGTQGVSRLLGAYTAAIEARAKAEAEDIRAESLVEKLAPELDEPAAELVREAEDAAPEEPAAEVALSGEVKDMQAGADSFKEDLAAAREQGEAMAEGMENMGKILAIFRRIAKGDRVPARDERKLLEYDEKLYNVAKQLGAMAENEKPKRHKSVDSEEEHKAAMQKKIDAMAAGIPDAPEAAASAQAPAAQPAAEAVAPDA